MFGNEGEIVFGVAQLTFRFIFVSVSIDKYYDSYFVCWFSHDILPTLKLQSLNVKFKVIVPVWRRSSCYRTTEGVQSICWGIIVEIFAEVYIYRNL